MIKELELDLSNGSFRVRYLTEQIGQLQVKTDILQ